MMPNEKTTTQATIIQILTNYILIFHMTQTVYFLYTYFINSSVMYALKGFCACVVFFNMCYFIKHTFCTTLYLFVLQNQHLKK